MKVFWQKHKCNPYLAFLTEFHLKSAQCEQQIGATMQRMTKENKRALYFKLS